MFCGGNHLVSHEKYMVLKTKTGHWGKVRLHVEKVN